MNIFDALTNRNCEMLTFVQDAKSGLNAVVAIHSTKRGPAYGGIRFLSYRNEEAAIEDALRLSEAMSYKAALADLDAGGGKCVLIKRPDMDRESAFEILGEAVNKLGGTFFTGGDVGTTSDDLRNVAKHTSYVASELDFGRATARGVFAAIRGALKFTFDNDSPKDRTVAIQGVGKVGAHLAKLLHDTGAKLILADIDQAAVEKLADETNAEVVSAGQIVSTKCDVLSPCALGAVFSKNTELNCRIIAGCANNQLATADADAALKEKGVVFVPDFVASAGALIKGVTEHKEGKEVGFEVVDRIFDTTLSVLERAKETDTPTEAAGLAMAKELLA